MNDINPNDMYFGYLDALRESGVVNMFGAESYLAKEFDLGTKEARTILIEWMKSFSPKQSDK